MAILHDDSHLGNHPYQFQVNFSHYTALADDGTCMWRCQWRFMEIAYIISKATKTLHDYGNK